jgi:hypothetical protein
MTRCVLALALLPVAAAGARADFLIRIGDIDGFGYGTAPRFRAANGGFANVDGSGVLTAGDFLPDINRNGILANGQGDEFDFRSADERAGTAVTVGNGVTNRPGTTGSAFTDISLARTYDERSAAGRILVGGNPLDGLVFGAGGAFPSPPSQELPNQPGFRFRFDAVAAAVDPNGLIFLNLIFGDYDVFPAEVRITGPTGTRAVALSLQGAGSDGLIQAATATLNFGDVFVRNGAGWRGALDVDFVAPNEPYTAFDYVELSNISLVTAVPGPSGVLLLGSGVACLAGFGRRRRSAAAA